MAFDSLRLGAAKLRIKAQQRTVKRRESAATTAQQAATKAKARLRELQDEYQEEMDLAGRVRVAKTALKGHRKQKRAKKKER